MAKRNQFEDLQVLDNPVQDEQMRACMALWCAKFVLHIKDYTTGRKLMHRGRRPAAEFYQAERWFDSPDTNAGSFDWCCHLFNLDPDRMRNRILIGWRAIDVRKFPGESQFAE